MLLERHFLSLRALVVIRFVFLCLIFSLAIAHDEQLSLYGVSAPAEVLTPGFGFEMATTVGNRTVLGLGMEYGSPQENERPLSLRLDGRLLYSSELDTHWYPQANIQWHVQDNRISYWVGAGFQRQLTSELGLTAESLWQPTSQNFQLRLGLRLWVMRFRSLDSRVRSSAPQGAVYTGGARQSQGTILIEAAAPVAAAERDEPAAPVSSVNESEPTKKPPRTAPALVTAEEKPVTIEPASPAGAYYVHLGIFRQQASMRELEQDRRLSAYQEQMLVWFDEEKSAYRLLIGPFSQPRATIVKNRLQRDEIESFIYQKPESSR
jgi:cell division septation protein DedD